MIPYAAPVEDMRFVLNRIVGLDRLAALPGYEEATPDLVDAVLDEAAKMAGNVLAPVNYSGGRQGARIENGVVRTPDGFPEAYRTFAEGGWVGMPFEPEYGGQGLPWTVATAVQEMVQAANAAFGLAPMLSEAGIEALQMHGTERQKALYLPKLMSGEWTGSMQLTEPHAGTDLSQLRCKAVRDGDRYRLFGQKIFITWGDHDMTDNILHLILARVEGAPAGVKGLSLFISSKYLVNEDGSLGARNDIRAVSLEHKLGIHASPTCVMAMGEHDGAVAELVGEENRGIECMFAMMNNARLAVGVQGIGVAERAYQQARDYARSRVQSRPIAGGSGSVAIIEHPDVRRMLLEMRAQTEAARALSLMAMAALDTSRRHPDTAERAAAQARVDLLTPLVKAWGSETGVAVANSAIQIHGGMGFMEETGVAQHWRDARIMPIYEGTNGIQANDLVFRKLLRDEGAALRAFVVEMRDAVAALRGLPGDDAEAVAAAQDEALDRLELASAWLLKDGQQDAVLAAGAAYPFLQLAALVAGGHTMVLALTAAQQDLMSPGTGNTGFLEAKTITARYFAEAILPRSAGYLAPIVQGSRTLASARPDMF